MAKIILFWQLHLIQFQNLNDTRISRVKFIFNMQKFIRIIYEIYLKIKIVKFY